MNMRKTIYYHSYKEDVVENRNQHFVLPEDYIWIRETPLAGIISRILCRIAQICAVIYGKYVLRIRVVNQCVLNQCPDTGFFLYGNHTQEFGDALVPVWLCKGKRTCILVSPANLGIPVLGRLLPYMGALPTPGDIKKLGCLNQAICRRVNEKNGIVIYPEAHLWPYYTKIRPFPAASFYYPVELGAPSFSMTTTYQKRKWRRKPRITVYLDGPFLPEGKGSKKEKRRLLCEQIYTCMKERSKNSSYEYIQYIKQ